MGFKVKNRHVAGTILGIIICLIGLVFWVVDYIIFTAIGALATWIGSLVGITGIAVLGIQIFGCLPVLGIMIIIFGIGLYIILAGLSVMLEEY